MHPARRNASVRLSAGSRWRTFAALGGAVRARRLIPLLAVSFVLWPAATISLAQVGIASRAVRFNTAPTPSGAEAAYPLNHSFDSTGGAIGTPPANHDFETAPAAVGTPPTNHDFTSGPTTVGTPPTNHNFATGPAAVGTPPTNHDFASGDFTGWTTTGAPTVVSDAEQGNHARLASSGTTITSAAITVDSTAQSITLKVKGLGASSDQYRIFLLSGANFATSMQLAWTTAADSWTALRFGIAAYQGQQVKLKLERSTGQVGFDDVGLQVADLAGWTVTGEPAYASDATQGGHASVGSESTITSAAFTIDSTTQVLSVKVKGLSGGADQYRVKLLSGAGFATSTELTFATADDAAWLTLRYEMTAWQGQTVKLRMERTLGVVGFDDAGIQIVEAPNWTATGIPARGTDGGNPYIDLGDGGSLTSSAFTVDSTAQFLTLRIKGLTTYADQYEIKILSGPSFGTVTTVLSGTADDASWTALSVNASAYTGQQIKLQVRRAAVFGRLGVDDAGAPEVRGAGWTFTNAPTRLTGGPTGAYLSTNGDLTSAAFTLPAGVQQIGVTHKGDSAGALFYFDLLRGAGFTQVVDLGIGPVAAELGVWKTYKAAVSQYAGETVKIRLRQHQGWLAYDNVGLMEQLVPGWTLQNTGGIAIGENSNGSYVTSYGTGGDAYLRSSVIQSGVIDRAGKNDYTYFAIAYEVGTTAGGLLRVTWYNNATGQNWVVHVDITSSPTGYRVRYFPVADFMGQQGYFVVQLGGSKAYSIADNLARQQLAEPFARKVGLHIDASTGGFGFSATDVLDFSPGLPLTFSRYHHAHSDRLSTLGYRWSHSFDTRLVVTDDSDAGVVYGDGREAFFDSISPTAFAAADTRVKDTLVKNGDGTYTLTRTSNHRYQFAADGKLLSITDKNNNTLTPAYDGQGRVATVTGPGGATLTFAYNAGGRLATVTNPEGGVTTYGYSAAGDLTSVQNPSGGTVTYTYNAHRLTQVTDETGKTVIINTLDAVHRVTTQTDADGKTIQLAYDTPGKGVTRVTDPNNKVAFYYHDAWHRTTDRQDPLGRVESYHFDAQGNLQRIVDPAANEWEFAYDDAGMMTTATDPNTFNIQITYDVKHLPTTVKDGRGNITTLQYDTAGNVTRKTDPLTHVWEYTYDARGNLLTEKNPLNQTTTYTYNSRNQQTSKTDPLGHTWTWTYSVLGHKTAESDPLGNTTTYTYDLFGRMLTRTDALNKTTTYTYNARGLMLSETDPLGNVTSYAYNDRHLLSSRTDPAGKVWSFTYDNNRNRITETNPLGQTTTYGYDDANRLVSVTDPLGRVSLTTYDTAGRVATEKDPLNRTTSYSYDDAGRLLTETLPNGGVTTYTYDADGNRLSERNALNQTTTWEYDAVSRQTKMTDPLGNITLYGYDAAGRMTSERDPLLQTTTTTYDAAGRVTAVTNPLGQTVTYTYDNANRRTAMSDPLARVTSYTYDAVGRPTATTDPGGVTRSMTFDGGGRLTGQTTPSGTTTYTYDPRGLKLTETNPMGHVRSYTYDNAGRMLSETDPLNRTTSYLYDAAGQRTRITDALGGTVQFTYDAAGQELTVTNPRGKTMTSTYDALGNVLTERDPLNRTTTRTYDLLGRLTSSTDPRGITVTSGYDAAGRVTAITYPGGGITYAYDAAGQRTGMTDASGTTSWTFDAAGRTTAIAAPQGTVGYSYNAAGERTSMSLPGGRMVTYTYDATSGRLSSLTDWAARTTSFGYDSEGRRTTTTRPNGVVSTTSHDAAGRRTAISHTKNGVTVQSFTATYDAAGNRTSVTGAAGAETYTYDALGRITGVTYPGGGGTATYTYDAHGNRLTLTQGGTTTTYTYDDADQLVSDGTNSFVYDAAGNLTTAGSQTYTWDWNSRMTSATVSGTTTTYTYDGDDVRTGRTQGSTTNFLWDRESGLPLLVDDGSFGYVYAGETPLDQLATGGTASSLLLDPLGSVSGLADGNGALSGSRDYDVYGTLRSSSGTYGRLGFTGEQMDAETGFVFLRARYHDPVTGRFVSRDTVQPNAPGSQGYHVYAYVANNPATSTDPSGHTVAAAALGVGSDLVGLQVGLSRGSDPLKAHSVALIIAAQMAATVAVTYQTISAFQELGVLELCAADDPCGRVLSQAIGTIEGVFNHPDQNIRKMLESIFAAFPMARMGVYLTVGLAVVNAVTDFVQSGRYKARKTERCQFNGSLKNPRIPALNAKRLQHVRSEHGRSAYHPNKPRNGKFDTDNINRIWGHITTGTLFGYAQGKSWHLQTERLSNEEAPTGNATCIMDRIFMFREIGWDADPSAEGKRTKCLSIVILNRQRGPLWTAFPKEC